MLYHCPIFIICEKHSQKLINTSDREALGELKRFSRDGSGKGEKLSWSEHKNILYFLDVLIYLLIYCCILGNIRAKWPSVCRRGMDSVERVVELFTGYKGPRSCVEVRTKAINKVKYSNGTWYDTPYNTINKLMLLLWTQPWPWPWY